MKRIGNRAIGLFNGGNSRFAFCAGSRVIASGIWKSNAKIAYKGIEDKFDIRHIRF